MKFTMGPRQYQAARLVATGGIPERRIAEEVGVALQTLRNWKERPEFTDVVKRYRAEAEEAMMGSFVAQRANRVAELDEIYRGLKVVVEERSAAYVADPDAHGGKGGFIVKTIKVIGTGKNQETITEYKVDSGLARELKDTLIHAAKELGQWSEKREVTGADGSPLIPVTEIVVDLSAGEGDG